MVRVSMRCLKIKGDVDQTQVEKKGTYLQHFT